MQTWRHKRTTDLGLRLGGAALSGLSYLAFRSLAEIRLPALPASPGLLAFALAAVGFACASAGCAFLMLGHHVFDQIEISSRWQPHAALERTHKALDADQAARRKQDAPRPPSNSSPWPAEPRAYDLVNAEVGR